MISVVRARETAVDDLLEPLADYQETGCRDHQRQREHQHARAVRRGEAPQHR